MPSSAFTIRPYHQDDQASVIQLWRICGLLAPQNDPTKDIERKLAESPHWFLVGTLDSKVIAACMFGYDGHRGGVNYLGVHPDHQRTGLARQLMQAAEHALRAVGCPKINLLVRQTNVGVLAFYEELGYTDNDCISLGKRLIPDH